MMCMGCSISHSAYKICFIVLQNAVMAAFLQRRAPLDRAK